MLPSTKRLEAMKNVCENLTRIVDDVRVEEDHHVSMYFDDYDEGIMVGDVVVYAHHADGLNHELTTDACVAQFIKSTASLVCLRDAMIEQFTVTDG